MMRESYADNRKVKQQAPCPFITALPLIHSLPTQQTLAFLTENVKAKMLGTEISIPHTATARTKTTKIKFQSLQSFRPTKPSS